MCTWPAHDQPAHGDCALVGQGEGEVSTQHLATPVQCLDMPGGTSPGAIEDLHTSPAQDKMLKSPTRILFHSLCNQSS